METQKNPPHLSLTRRRRDAQPLTTGPVVQESFFPGTGDLPLVLQPAISDLDLAGWLHDNREYIFNKLHAYGAILFRGFAVDSYQAFERTVASIDKELLPYSFQATPRTKLAGNIYTSTNYPADQEIGMHNENSYSTRFPRILWFYCVQPATAGGATPLADSRKVLSLLEPELVERFTRHHLLYERNYNPYIDLPWQTVFQTDQKEEAEKFCTEHDIDFEWISDTHLRTRHLCQAVLNHPVTGQSVWFNQAHLFHRSHLGQVLNEQPAGTLEHAYSKNVMLGNDQPINGADLERVRQVYDQTKVSFPWQKGDLLLVDNILVAHGRSAYAGERKIVVAMTGLHENRTLKQ